jgi:hypothetical protein
VNQPTEGLLAANCFEEGLWAIGYVFDFASPLRLKRRSLPGWVTLYVLTASSELPLLRRDPAGGQGGSTVIVVRMSTGRGGGWQGALR